MNKKPGRELKHVGKVVFQLNSAFIVQEVTLYSFTVKCLSTGD